MTIRFTDTELENATDFAARHAVDQPDNHGISQSPKEHKRNKLMKKGSFLFLTWVLLSFSLVAYTEPPIEVIYWKASDVQRPSQEELNVFNDLMEETQSFFASEMNHYGFGEKTFDFNKIKIVAGLKTLSYYTVSHWRLINESPLIERGFKNQIFVVFLGEGEYIDSGLALAQFLCGNAPKELIYCNNLVVVPTIRRHIIRPLIAHELGHAFGLKHVSNIWIKDRIDVDRIDVMIHPLAVIPGITMTLKQHFALSRNDATFLNKGGRLSIQKEPDTEIILDTDVNNDGYTDLYDCLIVRSGISIESNYDTDINNDGITNILDLMLVKAAAFEAIAAAAPSRQRVITTTWAELKKRQ